VHGFYRQLDTVVLFFGNFFQALKYVSVMNFSGVIKGFSPDNIRSNQFELNPFQEYPVEEDKGG